MLCSFEQRRERRILLFLKKKKQKDSFPVFSERQRRWRYTTRQKFFGSFFQKRTFFL